VVTGYKDRTACYLFYMEAERSIDVALQLITTNLTPQL
jgi:hypothetical protein